MQVKVYTQNSIILKTMGVISTVTVVAIMLIWCFSMTIYADSIPHFETINNIIMLMCIFIGVVSIVNNWKINDKLIILLTIAFFVIRLITYKINGLHITYGGNMMLQAFYLIGINSCLFGGRARVKAAIYTFVIFDTVTIFFCWYNYHFRYEYAMSLFGKYWPKGMNAQTTVFQNPNYPGMMIGAAIIFCCAALVKNRIELKRRLLLVPVIAFNAYMLIANTGCRSAETGLIIVGILALISILWKKRISVSKIISISLIISFFTLVPLFAVVCHPVNRQYLEAVSPIEKALETASSGRYPIWKTTILSQKGHMVFGYGNNATAFKYRTEYVKNYEKTHSDAAYAGSLVHKRQHNGYLATVNEAGLLGSAVLLLLLIRKAIRHKESIKNDKWEYLVLPYLFWINLFEAKMLNTMFFTGLLMMMMLLPIDEEQYDVHNKK